MPWVYEWEYDLSKYIFIGKGEKQLPWNSGIALIGVNVDVAKDKNFTIEYYTKITSDSLYLKVISMLSFCFILNLIYL